MLGDIVKTVGAYFAGREKNKATAEANLQNANLQREFAQNSIRWRVDDAKAAGIHPLYAIGAPTISASGTYGAETGMADALSSSSQDIGRAINATRTGPERDDAFVKSTQALSIQKMGLENELLASQIAKLKASQNPPMPSIAPVPEADKYEDRPKLHASQGFKWETDPAVTNADDAEKRYGELTDWLVGPYVLWRDMVHNSQKTSLPWWGGKTLFDQARDYVRKHGHGLN